MPLLEVDPEVARVLAGLQSPHESHASIRQGSHALKRYLAEPVALGSLQQPADSVRKGTIREDKFDPVGTGISRCLSAISVTDCDGNCPEAAAVCIGDEEAV